MDAVSPKLNFALKYGTKISPKTVVNPHRKNRVVIV